MHQYVGSMQQEAFVRPVRFEEGRAAGMQASLVKNGPLRFTVLHDKCMDIGELEWHGIQMSFLSKPGLTGRSTYDTHGEEAQRSIMGGMLFTCGLEHIGAPCQIDGKEYPMHGRIRTTPAEHVCTDARWISPETYRITLSGEMREAELFGENLTLRRRITTDYGEPVIRLRDVVRNEGYREEPCLSLYHCNLGFPFLDRDCRIVLPTRQVRARDADAARHEEAYDRMEAPKAGEPEYVFYHELASDPAGNTFAAAVNERLGVGLRIGFNKKQFPFFLEWKSLAAGDYVVGLEPANADVHGRTYYETHKGMPVLKPQQEEVRELEFRLLDTPEQFAALREEAQKLLAESGD